MALKNWVEINTYNEKAWSRPQGNYLIEIKKQIGGYTVEFYKGEKLFRKEAYTTKSKSIMSAKSYMRSH